MKRFVFSACLIALPAVAAAPSVADVNGNWSLAGEVQGVQVTETCALVQKNAVITGSCDTNTGKYDVKGKVTESTATFTHGGKYEGTDLTITYTGKVGSDGNMTGTIDVDPFSATGSFTATKAAAATK